MGEQAKIAVIGSYAVGMTIACEQFPTGGETVPGTNFSMMHGGKGSNQAVAAKRLGGNVSFGCCVGEDTFGDMCFQLFEKEGIDTSYMRRTGNQATGVGLIYVNAEGENEIVIDFGANKELSPADIDRMEPMIKECKMVLMQLEISMETVAYTAKKCQELGVLFILNPAPFQQIPAEVLANCDFLTPNQTEARSLLGVSADTEIADEEVAKRIHALGVKNVVMTLGGDGAMIVNDSQAVKVPGVSVKAIDTTGAGDTFNGAFTVALSEGKSLEEAAAFANGAAGLAVTKYGVIDAIPTREEVEAFLAENGRK